MSKVKNTLLLSVSLAFAASSYAQDRPQSMTIATASPGGVYAVYGEGVAALLSNTVGVKTSTRQTQGPVQNLVLLQSGRVELGMVTTGPAYEALNGDLSLKPGDKHEKVRALFPMYPTPFQMIALKESGIDGIEDFEGKRVGAGPKAGTGGTYWPRWIDALDISIDAQFGGIGDQASQLADGRLDGIVTAGGIPHPSFSELETTKDVNIFGMSEETLAGILKENPYAVEFTIPQATYKSQDSDLRTAAMWNFMAASSDMSDDLAYDIVKSVFENQEQLRTSHSAAKDTKPENILNNTFIPLHPGAARYYREVGIEIPNAINPPVSK